jgi:hypothetical protein
MPDRNPTLADLNMFFKKYIFSLKSMTKLDI